MSLQSVDSLIGNTYGTGGTNKPSGFKAGDFMIPGQVNRGVTITNSYPAYLSVLPITTILTYTFTANTPSTVSLNLLNGQVTDISEVVNFTDGELVLKLLSPTVLIATSDFYDYTMDVSGYDQYEQKTFSTQTSAGESNLAQTNVCLKYLSNVTLSLTAPLTGNQTNTVTIQVGGIIELPYTDYGNRNFLLNVVEASGSLNSAPYITMDGSEEDFSATYAFVYQPASWINPITASTGTPRPYIKPTSNAVAGIDLISQQIVYPTNEYPNLKATFVQFSEDNLTNVIGLKNYTQGWLPWDGGTE